MATSASDASAPLTPAHGHATGTSPAIPECTGGEAMVRMLEAHGVRHVFGLCGDTSLPFYDAFARLKPAITHVLTRDERSAAYMADGYARVSGRVGVCEGPSGGGATYLLPGVVEANESSIPVLAITTDIGTTARGRYTLTELDQQALYRPLTKWNTTLGAATDVPRLVRKAFTEMSTGRPGAVHLCFPFDVQKASLPVAEIWADPALRTWPARPVQADPQALRDIAEQLLTARAPLIICGGGVLISGGQRALRALAQSVGALVATSISGQGTLEPDDPLCVGVVGTNGGAPETRQVIAEADLIFFIGCRAGSVTTERRRAPTPQQRIVHLDIDPAVIGANYETAASAVGDARLSLQALQQQIDTGLLAAQASREGLTPQAWSQQRTGQLRVRMATLAERKRAKHERFMALAQGQGRPITPERMVLALKQALPEDAIVVADPGTPCPYLSAYLDMKAPPADPAMPGPRRRFITNRAHGALGYAMSAAVGAWFASPSSKVVAVMGDGSFGFTCGELETIVRHQVPLTMIVMSNAVFGWIKAGQKSGFGERYFSVDFSRTDHARVAEAFGVKSWRVEDPLQLPSVMREAMAWPGPTLIDIIAQPLQEAAAPVSEWIA